jgi:hypothetical protein
MNIFRKFMLRNERKINYMVGLAGKENDQQRCWTGIQMNFWPLVHPYYGQADGQVDSGTQGMAAPSKN